MTTKMMMKREKMMSKLENDNDDDFCMMIRSSRI
jgi:hypothetical protein